MIFTLCVSQPVNLRSVFFICPVRDRNLPFVAGEKEQRTSLYKALYQSLRVGRLRFLFVCLFVLFSGRVFEQAKLCCSFIMTKSVIFRPEYTLVTLLMFPLLLLLLLLLLLCSKSLLVKSLSSVEMVVMVINLSMVVVGVVVGTVVGEVSRFVSCVEIGDVVNVVSDVVDGVLVDDVVGALDHVIVGVVIGVVGGVIGV